MIYNKFHLLILIIIILCTSFLFTKMALDETDDELENFNNYEDVCTTNIGSCINEENINNVLFDSKIIDKKLESKYLKNKRNEYDYIKERDNIPPIIFDKDIVYERVCKNIKNDVLERSEENDEENN